MGRTKWNTGLPPSSKAIVTPLKQTVKKALGSVFHSSANLHTRYRPSIRCPSCLFWSQIGFLGFDGVGQARDAQPCRLTRTGDHYTRARVVPDVVSHQNLQAVRQGRRQLDHFVWNVLELHWHARHLHAIGFDLKRRGLPWLDSLVNGGPSEAD